MKQSTKQNDKVLVVDDDAVTLTMAREALLQGGFQVEVAADGKQALEVFDRCLPDIVLLDVQMPVLDGFETCSRLRAKKKGALIPILMITGLGDLESINQAYKVGATDFVTKPVNWLILRHRVRYMLRASQDSTSRLRSEARNRALLDAIPDLIFRLGRDGVFLDYKPAADVKFFVPPGDVLGKPISDVLPPEIAGKCLSHMFAALETRYPQTFEYSHKIDGMTREYEARMVVSGSEEVITLISDVTDKNQLEEELRQAQKMEALGLMAGGVAHDFNNTLTVINCSAGILNRKVKEDPNVKRRVDSILNATHHAKQLTDQLLAFSRRQVSKPSVLDLNAIIRDTERLLKRVMGDDVQIVTDLEESLWHVKLDSGQVQQVLMNLAVNARDAMPKGGTFNIKTNNWTKDGESSSDSNRGPGSRVCLTVGDTGCGMDKLTASRVFEPFFSTKGGRGTGLGLSTVFGIIRQSDGEISVESQPGAGTTFTMEFPTTEEQVHEVAKMEEESYSIPGQGTILVAENEEEISSLVQDILEDSGYLVLSAANGEQALAIAERYQAAIDLLLTDVVMPGLGGSRLAEAVSRVRPGIKVMYMSGYPDEVTLRHGVSRDRSNFLMKPFDPGTLVKKVQGVLAQN